uniref:Uncharacterized protein n=1 Tax=Ixodes ricinus TaxID=34613 RepID=A0A6B0UAL0_IXORI
MLFVLWYCSSSSNLALSLQFSASSSWLRAVSCCISLLSSFISFLMSLTPSHVSLQNFTLSLSPRISALISWRNSSNAFTRSFWWSFAILCIRNPNH